MGKIFLKTLLLALMCIVSTAALAQRTITGRVTDESGEGLPGASVRIKNANVASITDVNGNYSIKVPTDKTVLQFTYIGYDGKDETVGKRSKIDVVLKMGGAMLDEAVVVAYGTQRKGDVSGALTTMKPIGEDAATSLSIDNMLQGKVAGLNVSSSSSTVGAATSVILRGANSLRGDNQPLYVIDNVPQASTGEFSASGISGDYQVNANPLASLNPNDIEDITILKDASSTALYGSRGANGVILITTKKGKKGKARVDVSANFTIAEATRLYDLMNLSEYASYMNSRVTDGLYSFYEVDGQMRYVFNDRLSAYDANDPSTYVLITNRNWQKEIYRTAFSQNYALTLNGGSDNVTYYISASYKDVNGVVKNTSLKQGDLRSNINAQLNSRVKLGLSLSASLRQNDMMAGGNSLGGATGSISRTALLYAPYERPDDDPSLTNENKTTVFSWINDYVDVADNKTFNASLDLQWKILDNLTYNLRTGGSMVRNDRKRWYGLQLYQGMNNNGLLSISNLERSNYSIENVFNYNTKISDFINFDATLGTTYEEYKYLNQNIVGNDFSFYELRENGLHMAGTKTVSTPTQKDYQLLSFLGRVNFSFYDKYILTASLRADGSSKFAKGNRWGYFPSVALAWRMEQEAFMKSATWVNQLKPRFSVGVTGNQAIDPYSTFSMYGSSSVYTYADGDGNAQTTFVVTNLANNSLKWEKTTSWNLGVDFSLLKTRISGSIDVYSKKTSDLLISRTLPGSAGFSSTYYNQGSLTNKGFEMSVNAQIINKKDFEWSVNANIGVNSSKITELGLMSSTFGVLGERVGYYGNSLGDHFGVGHIFLEGEAPGLFLGYQTQGIVQTDDVQSDGSIRYTKADGTDGYYTSSYSTKAGDIKFVDLDGDGDIDTDDRTIIGNPNPDFTYGFSTKISWKSLSLSASFSGVSGRDVLNTNNRYLTMPGLGSSQLVKEAYYNMWTADNPSNLYPSVNFTVNNYVLDRYVEDASYLRCSDITLSYTLPNKWLKPIGFRTASAYLSVKNAFIITDYSGYDPEVNSFAFDGLRQGVDMSSYPTPRSFILGINLGF